MCVVDFCSHVRIFVKTKQSGFCRTIAYQHGIVLLVQKCPCISARYCVLFNCCFFLSLVCVCVRGRFLLKKKKIYIYIYIYIRFTQHGANFSSIDMPKHVVLFVQKWSYNSATYYFACIFCYSLRCSCV